MIVLIVLPRKDGTGEVNVTVRGMSPVGFKLRPDIGLAEGRWFQPGQREVVVSRSVNQAVRPRQDWRQAALRQR